MKKTLKNALRLDSLAPLASIASVALVAASAVLATPCLAGPEKNAEAPVGAQLPSAGPGSEVNAPSSRADGERVNVDTIKEKYWARGDEAELGVVQNRAYSKKRKVEFGLFGGTIMNDPFLNVKTLGGTLGFHFSEYFSAHLIGWKNYVSGSGAYDGFKEGIKDSGGVAAIPSTNDPQWYIGGEAVGSILYGKLSVLGKSIIYFDLHLLGGLGQTATDTGRNFTQHLGLGQKIYLSKYASLRLDYRLMHYNELLVKKSASDDQAAPPTLGAPIGERANWTHSITFGLDFLIGFGGGKSK